MKGCGSLLMIMTVLTEDEKMWPLNAFAVVSPPLVPYFPSHPLVRCWQPSLYGARTFFYTFLLARTPLISCGGDVEKATSAFFAFPIRTEQKVSARCIRGVVSIQFSSNFPLMIVIYLDISYKNVTSIQRCQNPRLTVISALKCSE